MKKMYYLCSTLVVVVMPATGAAQQISGDPARAVERNGFYGSVGLGRVEPDFTDAVFRNSSGLPIAGNTLRQEFDRAPLLRLGGGYNWRQWAIEVAYEHTVTDGDFSVGNTGGSFDYGNLSLAALYRGQGRFYPLLKLGLSEPDIDSDNANTRLRLDSSAFVGAGAGYRITPELGLEFDFTRSNDDTSTFMLGLRRHF